MEPELRARLANQIRRGDVVLFTGAGFSHAARSQTGGHIPLVPALKEELWKVAFPTEPFEPSSSLGDIYELARRTAGRQTRDLLERLLRVDSRQLPSWYETWFSVPWLRAFTVNLDDLEDAASRAFELPRGVHVLSALTSDYLSGDADQLLVVHLNGVLGDFPNATFSPPQYGERTARPDAWYQQFIRDLMSRPVVFVGTELDEPPLWQHLELRGSRGSGREYRPGSYLVSPSIPRARRALLREFNIDYVEADAESFAGVLRELRDECEAGLEELRRTARATRGEPVLDRVADLKNEPGGDLREYLMGRDPLWADLTTGFAIERYFEEEVIELVDDPQWRVVLLTGTAGSGKSTSLRRVALVKDADGLDVRWLSSHDTKVNDLRRAVHRASPDVLLIDDVDDFGPVAGKLLADLAEENPDLTVVATARGSRYEALEIRSGLGGVTVKEYPVPRLDDRDIDDLLAVLARANRLGRLLGLTLEQQQTALKERCGRQLLVAMIEATSGLRFDEKIEREFRELRPEAQQIYGTLALATHLGSALARAEALLAAQQQTNEGHNELQMLLNQHLVFPTAQGQLRVRHRLIADRVVQYMRTEGMLAPALVGLLFAVGMSVNPRMHRRSREWRLLVRLLNHAAMIRLLGTDAQGVREAYDGVEDILAWDFHYWLQRGSYEVEVGDLRLAQTYLEHARALAPEDYKVQTEWAYLTLKRAAREPKALGATERVEEAFEQLEDATERRGEEDSYPYHVMGSQGLAWVRQAEVGPDDKLQILNRLRSLVSRGLELHPSQEDLRQLLEDLERESLMTSV